MIPIFYIEEQGQRGCCPFPLHPKSPPTPSLRFAPDKFCLTIPNTYSTITMPASLRSDCCSPSLRNAVRLPSGNDVHLHRNTHLSNINLATANMADDTEALKHEFFFRGFFKKRGYYSLKNLTPDQYRSNPYFNSQRNRRTWLNAADAFGKDSNGTEVLSAAGEQEIDQVIGTAKDSVI